MALTKAQIRSKVLLRVGGNRTDLNSEVDTNISLTLSHVQELIRSGRHQPMPELERQTTITLYSGQPSYASYAAVGIRIDALWHTNSVYKLDYLPYEKYVLLDQTVQDRPRIYSTYEEDIYVWPLPSTTYDSQTLTMAYVAPVGDFASDTSTNPLGSEYDEAVILGATYRTLRDLEEVERANVAEAEYSKSLRSVDHNRRHELSSARPRVIAPVGY